MFDKRKKPERKNANKEPSRQQLFEGDVPDAAYGRARHEYFQANGQPIVERSRYFILSGILALICLGQTIAIVQMQPLKEIQPYVVGVDASKGLVGKADVQVMPAQKYEIPRPVIERELFGFVEKLYALNADYPKIARETHIQAFAYTRGRATEEFKTFIDQDQPYQRMAKTPGLVRKAERGTFNFRADGNLVLIRFKTFERDLQRPAQIQRNYVMSLQFERLQPSTQEELDRNPLGIYITHFEISEER